MLPPHLALLRLRRRLDVRGRPRIGRGVRISVAPGARVVLEDRCVLADGSVIVALSAVTVGAGAVVGEWAVLSDLEPAGADVEVPVRLQPLSPRPIAIGEGARVGAHAALGSGAQVAPGAAVGSYAVVPTPPSPA